MGDFFTREYHGTPFVFLGQAHIAALALILLANLFIVYFRKDFSLGQRKLLRYSMAALLLINETAWHAWNFFTDQWTIQTMLPLHLCSLLVFACAYMLVTRSYRVYEFAYFLGIGAATQALLTPDAGIYGFPHFRFFQIFISHGLIVTAAVYMTVVEGYRPYPRSLVRVLVWANVYMLLVFGINLVLGSNYLFINHKPETPSLIDVLGPWPVYVIFLEILALVMSLLLYLPFAWKDRLSARLEAARAD